MPVSVNLTRNSINDSGSSPLGLVFTVLPSGERHVVCF